MQACHTGALMHWPISTTTKTRNPVYPDREVNSRCPYCGVGCQVSYKVKNEKLYAEGRDGPANHNRLCVKGALVSNYIHHPHRLTKPLSSRNVGKDANAGGSRESMDAFPREVTWDEALDRAASGLKRIRDTNGRKALAGFGSAKGSKKRPISSRSGASRIGVQQRSITAKRGWHASSGQRMEGLNAGAVSAPFFGGTRCRG